jgi:hypothetical protein
VPAVSPTVAHLRARYAALTRDRPPDDPERVEAQRSLRAAALAAHVEKVVAGWPPLTDEQIDRVAALLRTGGGGDVA